MTRTVIVARSVAVVGAAAGLTMTACGGSTAASGDGDRLRVTTTVAPITSIVASVAGDAAEVTGTVPEGADSHTFEPAPSVAETLSTSDVLFLNGLQLEQPVAELAESTLPADAPVVRLGEETITPDEYVFDFSFPQDEGLPNPHLWTNPPMVGRYAEVVNDTLSQLDPDRAAIYRANYEAFAERVDELDAAMRQATTTLAPDERRLLTYHDSFPYFAREYGWEIIGAIQPSDFSEPSPGEVADLIDQVRRTGVPAIFGSEVFPSPVLRQVGAETGTRYVDDLRDDDLPGEPGDAEHSWLGLMRFNFATMVEALGGDASAIKAVDVTPTVPDGASYPQ
jgi:ABC-type Zn uptake system ZnuABC Zn-binding protein ZnuA